MQILLHYVAWGEGGALNTRGTVHGPGPCKSIKFSRAQTSGPHFLFCVCVMTYCTVGLQCAHTSIGSEPFGLLHSRLTYICVLRASYNLAVPCDGAHSCLSVASSFRLTFSYWKAVSSAYSCLNHAWDSSRRGWGTRPTHTSEFLGGKKWTLKRKI